MPDQIVEFEVRRQDFLTPGWVIVARWPNGREEPLIGLSLMKLSRGIGLEITAKSGYLTATRILNRRHKH